MKLSNSKLSCILNNPKDYELKYILGINPREKKEYFSIGSAVHWGLENDTEDLTQWFKENGTLSQRLEYSQEQEQAEAMVHGFFKQKDKIMKEVFEDYETKEQLTKAEEFHELELESKIPSSINNEPYDFMGIIDLLYLTDKGFILMDYKTSSVKPDFSKYLDQIYRYIFLLEDNFPDIPIYKIGIINIVKSRIKKIKNESDFDFRKRWKDLYEKEDSDLINVHMYNVSLLDRDKINAYKDNLSKMADLAQLIENNKVYYLDAKHASGEGGSYPSVYLDIYENRDEWWLNYTIKDKLYDYNSMTDEYEWVDKRVCYFIDMFVINHQGTTLNQYEDYELIRKKFNTYEETIKEIIKTYDHYDGVLLVRYENTYKEILKNAKD